MDVAGETQASRQVGNGCDLVIVLQVYGLGVLATFPKELEDEQQVLYLRHKFLLPLMVDFPRFP